MHTIIEDHSRLAYAEICPDEKAATAIAVLQRASAWFADHGITVGRVLSDNGSCYRSIAWREACTDLGIVHKQPGVTDPRPTERSNASTGHWPRAGRLVYHVGGSGLGCQRTGPATMGG